jgi:hypothetical protein
VRASVLGKPCTDLAPAQARQLRVEVVDLAETDAAFRDSVRREGIVWIDSGSV